jgi:hypothetical protein
LSNVSQQGWVLPATLFGLALILATIRLLAVDQTGVSQIFGDIRRAHTLRQLGDREILSAKEPRPLCERRAFRFEEQTLTYEICGESRVPWMIAPSSAELPISRIDYDAIFTLATPCSSTPVNAPNTFGTTPIASKNCVVPATLNGGIISVENIRGEATHVLARSAQTSIIASPGQISVTGTLTLESDLMVVAGGDIAIGTITTTPSQTRKVTIISALGGIRVGSVGSGVSVIAAGRSTIEIPENPYSPPFPIPPRRGHEIIGIRAVGE